MGFKISIAASFLLFLSSSFPAFAAPTGKDLYDALLFQDVPKVKDLIAKGADVNYKEGGRPLLGWAAQSGNVELVDALLKASANVDPVDEGMGHTPLMRAVETQQLEIVKRLVQAKANANAKTPSGETVLDMAVESGKAEIVEAVIQGGADVKYVSPEGDSPALAAAMVGLPDIVPVIKVLGKAGANMNASNIIHTPLTYASEQGYVEIVAALLEGGADPNAKSQTGKAPIQYASKKEVVDLLIKAKADLNVSGEYDSPIIIRAIENGDDEIVKALISAGANVNVRNQYGKTPLEIATDFSKSEMVELLKKSGASQ